MKKTVIRPFEIGSVLLLIIGFVFPVAFIFSVVSLILKDSVSTWLLCGVASAVLTYFISVSALRIVFESKFVFYDKYVEVTYFDTLGSHFADGFYKIITPQKIKINYADIEKFGSFEGNQIRKNGRDDNNNLSVLISVDGVPVSFIIPKSFENLRNYFLINDKNQNSFMIDGKMYSVSQVKKILKNLEKFSHKEAIGGYPKVPNMIGFFVVGGILAVVAVPYALVGLECKINPTHTRAVDYPSRTIYFLCCMAMIFTILVNILFSKSPTADQKDAAEQKRFKIICSLISLVFFVAAAVMFVLTLLK